MRWPRRSAYASGDGHMPHGLLPPDADAVPATPPCVSSVVQLARVLARCVLAAAVVSVASAESKDGDPKKVCVLADAAGGPRAARRACPRVYAI
jgi:hypothetical protein